MNCELILTYDTPAYMFNVHKKTNIRFLPSSVAEKNAMRNILDGQKDGRTDKGKTVNPPPVERQYKKANCFGVSKRLLFNANSALFQLYYGENKLIFNEMMMRSALF